MLGSFISKWRHLCYLLVGFNSTFEEDMYRFRRLNEMGIDGYIMQYKGEGGETDPFKLLRLQHFARWINGRIYKKCPDFEQYTNWMKAQAGIGSQLQLI